MLGASNSKKSINKALAVFVAEQLKVIDVNVLDLKDYELTIYSAEIDLTAAMINDKVNQHSKIISDGYRGYNKPKEVIANYSAIIELNKIS